MNDPPCSCTETLNADDKFFCDKCGCLQEAQVRQGPRGRLRPARQPAERAWHVGSVSERLLPPTPPCCRPPGHAHEPQKRIRLAQLPPVLCLALKRMKYDSQGR